MEEKINAVCILALNIINDKVFAVVWWWSVVVVVLGILRLFYTATLATSSSLRFFVLSLRLNRSLVRSSNKRVVKDYVCAIPRADWFVLYQLSKNLYQPFFMEFITSLSLNSKLLQAGGQLKSEEQDMTENLLCMVTQPAYQEAGENDE